jgi:hypothetical protein
MISEAIDRRKRRRNRRALRKTHLVTLGNGRLVDDDRGVAGTEVSLDGLLDLPVSGLGTGSTHKVVGVGNVSRVQNGIIGAGSVSVGRRTTYSLTPGSGSCSGWCCSRPSSTGCGGCR